MRSRAHAEIVALAPAVQKFDGATMAGCVAQEGYGELQQMIGTSEEIYARQILEWMKNDMDDEDEDEADPPYDLQKLHDHVRRLAPKLFRSCDAHHLQSAIAPISMLVANFFYVSLSSTSELVEGTRVQAKYDGSVRFYNATVVTVNEDETANLVYEERPGQQAGEQDEVENVLREHIRDYREGRCLDGHTRIPPRPKAHYYLNLTRVTSLWVARGPQTFALASATQGRPIGGGRSVPNRRVLSRVFEGWPRLHSALFSMHTRRWSLHRLRRGRPQNARVRKSTLRPLPGQ